MFVPAANTAAAATALTTRLMRVSSVVFQTDQRILREHTTNRYVAGKQSDARQRERRQRHRQRIARGYIVKQSLDEWSERQGRHESHRRRDRYSSSSLAQHKPNDGRARRA